jgi:hypothetical protein
MKTIKNEKHKIKHIDIAMFGCSATIVITNNPDDFVHERKLQKYALRDDDEILAETCNGVTFQKECSEYYAILPPDAHISDIAHEAFHLAHKITDDRDMNCYCKNDGLEIIAYLTGFFTQQIHSFITKETGGKTE